MVNLLVGDLNSLFTILFVLAITQLALLTDPPDGQDNTKCNTTFSDLRYKGTHEALAIKCPAGCLHTNGSVWGTDLYRKQSSICRAAIHSGRIKDHGGMVWVKNERKQEILKGTTRNGIQSMNYNYTENEYKTFSIHDFDECTEELCRCNIQLECIEPPNGYQCECNSLLRNTGNYLCTKIKAFSNGTSNCDENASCLNNVGSFTCTCNTGFSGDGVFCSDINECSDGTSTCDENASCVNEFGGFTCRCNIGYFGDGVPCSDVDECTETTRRCDTNAKCKNTEGSFTCSCKDGYTGDGYNCTDVDECYEGIDNCHEYAICMNTVGSFNCSCRDGYTGDGYNCKVLLFNATCNTPARENAFLPHQIFVVNCPPDCVNAEEYVWGTDIYTDDSSICRAAIHSGNITDHGGVVSVRMEQGHDSYHGSERNSITTLSFCDWPYSFTLFEALPHDECSAGTHDCSEHASCRDTPGGFECTCNKGFAGDGHTCTDY